MFNRIRADLQHYIRFCGGRDARWWSLFRILYAHPAAFAVIWYRFGAAAWRTRIPFVRQILQLIYLLGMPWVRLYSGVQIQPQTEIDGGLAIMHFGGVVITRECKIGENCLFYHNVNIVTMRNKRGPTIGANFYAGTGSIMIGTLTIEDNVTVGAGAIVTKNIPKDAVVAGVPARIIRFRQPGENLSDNKGPPCPYRLPGWMEAPEPPPTYGAGLSPPD